MGGLIGFRLSQPDTGLQGTVVSARNEGAWRGAGVAYDVVWDDGACSIKMTVEAMAAAQWVVGQRKASFEECNRIWTDYQVERARRMQIMHSSAARRIATPIVVDRQERMRQPGSASVVRLPEKLRNQTVAAPDAAAAEKPASWHARRFLAQAMTDVNFAVSVERKKLSVGWIDGPVQQRVEETLKPLIVQGRVERIIPRRGASEVFVQAAIEFVLQRVWPGKQDQRTQEDRVRVSSGAFLNGSMATVMTPLSSPIGVVPYAHLLRCVMDGWDHSLARFIDVERTRYLRQEVTFLFPGGLDIAAVEFCRCLASAHDQSEAGRDRLVAIQNLDRARG